MLSYVLWVYLSTALHSKIKRIELYVLFPTALYAIPAVYFLAKDFSIIGVMALSLPILLALGLKKNLWGQLLTPLPLILYNLYELLVNNA